MSKDIGNMNLTELREECRARGIAAEETATKTELLTRIVLVDGGQQPPDLPPPGHARDEELARRTDELARRAEVEAPEVFPIDPDALEEDREILHALHEYDMLAVSNAKPGYTYCWSYYGQNGQMVWMKKAVGWEVVKGKQEPEAREHMDSDGTRTLGDVLLMRIPTEHYETIVEQQRRRREAQEFGVSADVIAYARKHGLKVHEDLSTVKVGANTLMDVMQKKAERRTAAKKTAMQHLDKKLREGQVPGLRGPST